MEKLLFTGGTGFLGHNIKPILDNAYEVTTFGITSEDDIKCSILSDVSDIQKVIRGGYDIVLHAAGKAHIYPKTQEEVQSFFDINYQGTVNLCTALENTSLPKSFIYISTVAVYGLEEGELITEENPLKGESPYAKSKIMAEKFLQVWAKTNCVNLGIIRPCLMAGVNAPGNLGAMVRGIKKGIYLSIDHGKARKSILMTQDIANLLPLIAEKGGVYNVSDSHHPSYGELAEVISKQLGKKAPYSIPYWVARCLAIIGDIIGGKFPIDSKRLKKLTQSATYNSEKAQRELGWKPLDVLENYKV